MKSFDMHQALCAVSSLWALIPVVMFVSCVTPGDKGNSIDERVAALIVALDSGTMCRDRVMAFLGNTQPSGDRLGTLVCRGGKGIYVLRFVETRDMIDWTHLPVTTGAPEQSDEYNVCAILLLRRAARTFADYDGATYLFPAALKGKQFGAVGAAALDGGGCQMLTP